MNYKLLSLDIDGTVVKEHTNTPTSEVITALQKAQEKIMIILVSARAWKDQQIIVKMLGLENSYHVIENGTKVINPKGELEYSKLISVHEAKQILGLTSSCFNEVGLCIDGCWVNQYSHLSNELISTLSLICYSSTTAQEIPFILQKLPTNYSITVGSHWSNPQWSVVLISHKNASKGAGLRYVQQKLNILPEETIMVGDGASDISAMQYANVKVAMGNAEAVLKEVANFIAPSVHEDGLVEVINRFVVRI